MRGRRAVNSSGAGQDMSAGCIQIAWAETTTDWGPSDGHRSRGRPGKRQAERLTATLFKMAAFCDSRERRNTKKSTKYTMKT